MQLQIPFNEFEVESIGNHCRKMSPITRIVLGEDTVSAVIFPMHDICMIKQKTVNKEISYVLYEFNLEDQPEVGPEIVLGNFLTDPIPTIEETVFTVLALAACTLEKDEHLHTFEPESSPLYH